MLKFNCLTQGEWNSFVEHAVVLEHPGTSFFSSEIYKPIEEKLLRQMQRYAVEAELAPLPHHTVKEMEPPSKDCREVAYLSSNGMEPDEISATLDLDYRYVIDVLEGKIHPYPGGKMLPLFRRGLNLKVCYTPAQLEFFQGVLARIAQLPEADQKIILNSNGLTVDEALTIVEKMEPKDARESRLIHRCVLQSSPQGKKPARRGKPSVPGG